MQAFLETGTIHLLVISGLNVGILAACLFFVDADRPGAARLGAGDRGLGCVLYAVTTDAQPPVVRATVMVLVACLAMLLGRRALAFNSIAAAGLVVLALNPAELFQAGTQLSFLSVAVLAWFAERAAGAARARSARSTDRRHAPLARARCCAAPAAHVWRAVLVSLVIWLVICSAGDGPLSPGFAGGRAAGPDAGRCRWRWRWRPGFGIFAFGWIGAAVGDCSGLAVRREPGVHGSVRRTLPATGAGSHFWVSGPADWWLVGFYGALAVGVFVPRCAPPRRWCFALLAGWIAAGAGAAARRAARRGSLATARFCRSAMGRRW